MKTINWLSSRASSVAIASVLFVFSCHQNEFTNAVLSHIQSEAVSDSFQTETIDISSVAVNNTAETLSGGRVGDVAHEIKGLGDIDDRFKCAVVTQTKDANSTFEKPSGKITIDFGSGCTDPRGKTRKGMIIITYSGKRFTPGSTIIVTTKDFYKSDARVEGTVTLKNISPTIADYPKFEIVTSGKLIFPDATIATREQTMMYEWQRASNPSQDKLVIDGYSSGINKLGKSYDMKITSSLIYSKICQINNKVFIPVKGTKTLTVDSKVITIDYGDGSCDNTITITCNGTTKIETLTDNGK